MTDRRQWGRDRRSSALPAVPGPISERRIAGARLAIMLTVVAWIGYLGEWLFGVFLGTGNQSATNRAEEIAYLLIVSLLTASTLAYLLSRLGFLYRARLHHRAGRAELDEFFERETPTLNVIVPSYQEDARVIRTTLLSAALQEYPDTRIVLLIDDPPKPRSLQAADLLEQARQVPRELQELLSAPAARFAAALAAYESSVGTEAYVQGEGLDAVANEYEAAAAWVNDLANRHELVDHSDAFFVNEVARRLQRDLAEVAGALRQAGADGGALSQRRVRQMYRRLAWTFRAEFSSFERKQYVSLSHEPNKATNLNSYLGLMGGRYRAVQTVTGSALVPAGLGPCDLEVPDPDYVLTLDADSMLLPEYCLRLVHLMEQQAYQEVAISQTPYSAFTGSATRIERIAGATTDLQHIVHQGLSYYDATFWVGANAVIRKRALDDIAITTHLGDWEVKTYIRDHTVIEDTESTVDLGTHGWKLYNYPERLSYSATPPDFGALCIQRRRWANGGLLILPKLRPQRRARKSRGERTRFGETFLRWNYMASITWSSISLVLMLAFPFGANLLSPLLGVIALPYFWCMASDLRSCGYKRLDVVRIYGFNLLLLPVNLAGTLASVIQALTASKSAFARTPKVRNRTVTPAQFIVFPIVLLLLSATTGYEAWLHGRSVNLGYAAINTLLLAYALVAFVGVRHMLVDLWVFVRVMLSKPAAPRRRRLNSKQPEQPVRRDWRSVLQVPLVEPALTAPHSVVRASALDADSLLDDWAEAQIVFQPIVELERGEIVGYEALARFADGPNIELRLAQAFSTGRGPSLESRLARAALRAASRLPKPAWVAVKASPTVIGNDPRLLAVLQETSRPVVLEVAESEAAEIARLTLDPVSSRTTGSVVPEGPPRAASRLLTPANTSIAIEHATGGNRTVRLMQQVRPRYVKLDRSVCRRLPGDSVRQAQLQILLQAAGAIRTTIVATGVETEAERSTLIALGVSLGQGYLLGQPRSLVDA